MQTKINKWKYIKFAIVSYVLNTKYLIVLICRTYLYIYICVRKSEFNVSTCISLLVVIGYFADQTNQRTIFVADKLVG